MLLYIIRHGDPHYPTDSLTARGVLQAEAVGKRLALYGVDKIYASSSNRAMQTAEPTCEILKKDKEILDFHRAKIEERAKAEGREASFQMVVDDVYAIGKGRLVGRPKY